MKGKQGALHGQWPSRKCWKKINNNHLIVYFEDLKMCDAFQQVHLYLTFNCLSTAVGLRFAHRSACRSRCSNCLDLIDVTIIFRAPIATPTVVEGDLFFRQG